MTQERIWIHPADPAQLYVTQETPDTVCYRRDDQECVWKRSGPLGYFMGPIYHWVAGCSDHMRDTRPQHSYCPYCGNRIRVEEAE